VDLSFLPFSVFLPVSSSNIHYSPALIKKMKIFNPFAKNINKKAKNAKE
jgi:hypothetical protein